MLTSPSEAARSSGGLPAPICSAIAEGRLGDAFAWLGLHSTPDGLRITTFDPGASDAWITDEEGNRIHALDRVHPSGVFSAELGGSREAFKYRLAFRGNGNEWLLRDPYSFGPVLGELDIHLLAEGRHWKLYERLGAHSIHHEGVAGVAFAVWAPNARRVSVVGDFNFWDGRRHPMRLRYGAGIWEIFLPDLENGARYKFEIIGPQGDYQPLKTDPVSFQQEVPPATTAIVSDLVPPAAARDEPARAERNSTVSPISIYEVHLGSWRRGDGGRHLTYDELADTLVTYAADQGFTHLEFLPISEHPFSGSWGYQPIGLYAPTARFGDPEAFTRLVDACHAGGLGVILDWVPAHFPSDAHGLARFDGTFLYEHQDPRLGHHKDWDTLIYNYGRREVANYLIANALYWLEHVGVDGLRVDAVASMLYLDYSRAPGEWVPNVHGGNENLEAIAFLEDVNQLIAERCPGAVTLAEESTSWPRVSRPVEEGGLGFRYKWNMGWMHDTLTYMSKEPVHRKWHHHMMTFGLVYAWSENFILPLSHDEVVHGKGSLLGKMPGDRWQKFANLRAYYGFMWAHPGKKLLFMGSEFGQEAEWNHDSSLHWHLLDEPEHAGLQRLLRDLNQLYCSESALHALDCDPRGFAWIDADDGEQSVYSFERHSDRGTTAVVICNFTPVVRHDYEIGVNSPGVWLERINTDSAVYGGSNIGNAGKVEATPIPRHGRPFSVRLTLPPLATLIFSQPNVPELVVREELPSR